MEQVDVRQSLRNVPGTSTCSINELTPSTSVRMVVGMQFFFVFLFFGPTVIQDHGGAIKT